MAVKNKKKNIVLKKGKKKWMQIQAPALFNNVVLGESYVFESDDLKNKYLTMNLSTITKNIRKQNANVQFKVIDVVEGKGVTEVVGYNMITASLKRLIKRGRDKISDSFICKTKDKKIIRIKPILVNVNNASKNVNSSCRLETRKIIKEFCFQRNVEEIISEIIEGKLQKQIKDVVKKIYPLKSVDIRMAKVEENTGILITDKAIEDENSKRRKVGKDSQGKKWKDASSNTNEDSEMDELLGEKKKSRTEEEVSNNEDSDEEDIEDESDEEDIADEDAEEEDSEEDSKKEIILSDELEDESDEEDIEDADEEDSEDELKEESK